MDNCKKKAGKALEKNIFFAGQRQSWPSFPIRFTKTSRGANCPTKVSHILFPPPAEILTQFSRCPSKFVIEAPRYKRDMRENFLPGDLLRCWTGMIHSNQTRVAYYSVVSFFETSGRKLSGYMCCPFPCCKHVSMTSGP